MNKEIKEILNNIQNKYEDYYVQDIVSGNDLKLLSDCITNLQKRIYKARKMIFDNYGLLDKYGIEMLDDILKGDSDV